ncbi:MAG: cell division protein FtsZ [Bacteriovoracaceae bacterium]|nr:cell division protein FtsZ [Bacteriovoracaceae bacterium]
MFEISDEQGIQEIQSALNLKGSAKIKVIGVGGAGSNAINTMITAGLKGVEYIVANTDSQALNASLADVKIQLGTKLTKGLGAGSNPEVGMSAALEEASVIKSALAGTDMLFITAGMGGGTGTGAAPIIASIAREMGILTVGVVTRPFQFEGKKRRKQAEGGLEKLQEQVDSLITLPNQKLLDLAGESLSLVETFKKADEVLYYAVQGISDLINSTGLINADFADVCTIMRNKGIALMGTGLASGDNRALRAANSAISSPLLEDVTIDGATGIIINITANNSLTTFETNQAVSLIMEAADEDAEIIFGTVINNEMDDHLKVTVIATGLKTIAVSESKTIPTPVKEIIKTEESLPQATSFTPPEKAFMDFFKEEDAYQETTMVSHDQTVILEDSYEQPSFMATETVEIEISKVEVPVAEAKVTPLELKQEETLKENIYDQKAKSIAEKLGFLNFDEDEFDTPSFLRKGKSPLDLNP